MGENQCQKKLKSIGAKTYVEIQLRQGSIPVSFMTTISYTLGGIDTHPGSLIAKKYSRSDEVQRIPHKFLDAPFGASSGRQSMATLAVFGMQIAHMPDEPHQAYIQQANSRFKQEKGSMNLTVFLSFSSWNKATQTSFFHSETKTKLRRIEYGRHAWCVKPKRRVVFSYIFAASSTF